MASLHSLSVVLFISAIAFHPSSAAANFYNSVYFYWGAQSSAIQGNGDDLQLVLDQTSGSGIKSTGTFLFGSIEMLIKLVPGNSAGTVTAYYVSSTGDRHDEIDFEFPNKQGMGVYSSLWNADNWATQGGRIKIDWNSAPFIARYRNFRTRACNWHGAFSINQCASNMPGNWWTPPTYSRLSYAKLGQMNWVRDNYMIYDYCKDTKRFNGQMPPECFKPQY